MKYTNEELSEIHLVSDILSDLLQPDEMNPTMIQSLLECELDHKLIDDDLELLATTYNIGFCLVTNLQTKRLEHDIIIKLPRHYSPETPVILLYQYETTLIHILKKKEPTIQLKDITSTLFIKHMKEQI
jgi:hypothetical protein